MTTEEKFNCVFCKESFDNKETLQIHFRQHGDPYQHYCINKSKKQTSSEGAKTPEKKESDEKEVISCDVCPEVFATISKAITHKHKVHPEYHARHFCSWCGKLFTMKHLYDKHLKSHESIEDKGDYPCDSCEVIFFLPSAMQYHNKFYHRQDTDLPALGQSKKQKLINKELLFVHYCMFCGEEYINKVNLHKHMSDDHGDEEQSPPEVMRCPLCDAIFYHLDAYQIHLTFHSIDDIYGGNEDPHQGLTDFTLETVPPTMEKVENIEAAEKNDEMGIEQFLQLAMETDTDFLDEEALQPSTSEKRKHKKHKKHKKSKKPAITLDEFLTMNTDVFGEGLDFHGIEEVPTQVVTKQLNKVKKPSSLCKPNAKGVTAANLQKLKQQGVTIKMKGSNKPLLPGTKVNSNMSFGKPIKIANTVLNANKKKPAQIRNPNLNPTLSKLMSQTNNELKIVKKQASNVSDQVKPKLISQTMSAEVSIKPVISNKNIDKDVFANSDSGKSESNILRLQQTEDSDKLNQCDDNEESYGNEHGGEEKEERHEHEECIDKKKLLNNPELTIKSQPVNVKSPAHLYSNYDETAEVKEKQTSPIKDACTVGVPVVNSTNCDKKSDNVDEKPTVSVDSTKLSNDTATKSPEQSFDDEDVNDEFDCDHTENMDKCEQKNNGNSKVNNCPTNKLLLNTQLTVKTTKTNTPKATTTASISNKSIDNHHDMLAAFDDDDDKMDEQESNHQHHPPSKSTMTLLKNSQITVTSHNITKPLNQKPISEGNSKLLHVSDDDKIIEKVSVNNEKPIKLQALPISDNSKHKLLANSQLTIKSVKSEIEPAKLCNADEETHNDKTNYIPSNGSYHQEDIEMRQNKHPKDKEDKCNSPLLQSRNKLLNNSQITIKSSNNKQFKSSEIPNKTEPVDTEDSQEDDIEQNVNDYGDETYMQSTNKLLNNAALTIKTPSVLSKMKNQIIPKPNITVPKPPTIHDEDYIETILDDSSDEEIQKDISNVQKTNSVILQKQSSTYNSNTQSNVTQTIVNKSSMASKSMNILKNVKGITVKSNSQSVSQPIQSQPVPQITYPDTSDEEFPNEDLHSDDAVEIESIEGDSCDETEVQGHSILDNSTQGSKEKEKFVNTSTFSNIKNRIGSNITFKSLNMVNSTENSDNEPTDDAENTDSDSNKFNERESIVNKLKSTNLGLSVKPIKSTNNSSPSIPLKCQPRSDTKDGSTKTSNPGPSAKRNIDEIVGSTNKNVTSQPLKQFKTSHQSVNDNSSQLVKTAGINKNSSQLVSQEMVAKNEAESVSQEVTVKTFQTKTVIQEITTTVTKTVRTVNQSMNEQVNAPPRNQTIGHIRGATPAIRSPRIVQEIKRPANPIIANQGLRVKTAANVPRVHGHIVRPSFRSPAPARPNIAQNRMQLKSFSPGMTGVKVAPPTVSNKPGMMMGKPLKVAPNVIKQSGNVVNTPLQKSGPFSCFKKPKESMSIGDASEFSPVQASESNFSQTTKRSFSSTNSMKMMNSSSMMATQMKSEYSASSSSSSTSSVSQQFNRISGPSGMQMIKGSGKPTQSAPDASNPQNVSLIEKLQLQGLLVKKPRLEPDYHSDESYHSNDECQDETDDACVDTE